MKIIALLDIPDGMLCTDCPFLRKPTSSDVLPSHWCLVFNRGCNEKLHNGEIVVYKVSVCVNAEDTTDAALTLFNGLDGLANKDDEFL